MNPLQRISNELLPAIATVQQGPRVVSNILNTVHSVMNVPPLVRKAIMAGIEAIGNNETAIKELYKAALVFDQVCPLVSTRSIVGLPPIPAHYCTFGTAAKDILRFRAQQLGASPNDLDVIEQSVFRVPKDVADVIESAVRTKPKQQYNYFWTYVFVGLAALFFIAFVVVLVYFTVNKNKEKLNNTNKNLF